MTNLKAKLTSAIAIASFATAFVAPAAFADTNVVVKGNGKKSTNKVVVVNKNITGVVQGNATSVVNTVTTTGNTGGNKANGNTGGNVTIDTGKVKTDVSLTNGGSSNVANVDPCGCPDGNVDVKVKDNGSKSTNTVVVKNVDLTFVGQFNLTSVVNTVTTTGTTGNNKANGNTDGDVTVDTGKVVTDVTITNTGSTNTLNP